MCHVGARYCYLFALLCVRSSMVWPPAPKPPVEKGIGHFMLRVNMAILPHIGKLEENR